MQALVTLNDGRIYEDTRCNILPFARFGHSDTLLAVPCSGRESSDGMRYPMGRLVHQWPHRSGSLYVRYIEPAALAFSRPIHARFDWPAE